jgi:hypothetical protein
MEWGSILTTIAGGVGSAATGGILGLVGSGLGAIVKYFQANQEHKQKLATMRLEMEMMSQEGAWKGLKESIKADAAVANTYKWVNAVKSLYRPALTTLLVIISYVIFLDILGGMADAGSTISKLFTYAEIKDLLRYIVYSLVFSAATAIVWWFGDRAFVAPELKNR